MMGRECRLIKRWARGDRKLVKMCCKARREKREISQALARLLDELPDSMAPSEGLERPQ